MIPIMVKNHIEIEQHCTQPGQNINEYKMHQSLPSFRGHVPKNTATGKTRIKA